MRERTKFFVFLGLLGGALLTSLFPSYVEQAWAQTVQMVRLVGQDGQTQASATNPLPVNLTAGGTGGLSLESTQTQVLSTLQTIRGQAIPSCTATPVVSTSAEAGHILKNTGGTLCGVYANNLTAVNAYLMVFNLAAVPGDGAVTPIECVVIAPNGVASISYGTGFGSSYATGISVAISSTGCFTKTTTGMTAFFHGQVL